MNYPHSNPNYTMEDEYNDRGKPKPHNSHSHPSAPNKSDVISSAKLIADAAKSTLSHDKDNKIDKAEIAGAAGNLLGAAKHYAKLDEKSYGKYVGKAETYLHQYHSSHSSDTTTAAAHAAVHTDDGKHGHFNGGGSGGASSQSHSTGGGGGHSSGGYGEYVKMAQGFLNKKQDHGGDNAGTDHGHGHGHSSGGGGGGGAADYIKLAQGLLNKKDDHGQGHGNGGSGHSSGGVGAGDYIKLAQGFMKKH